ncbi:hypothetical protein H4Q26_018048 [Puccinia striiformis f. sp. tritici PST-130]|nr:hypothetical protein H4Q26_018048 [Puccinia striiformis f. sp. tritici PST-130]
MDTQDSVKPEEEIQLHIEADRQSKASSSQFSREDSPIRSQTTSHQLTNDDWPVTPPSPDCFPSPDLMIHNPPITTPPIHTPTVAKTEVAYLAPQVASGGGDGLKDCRTAA